MIQAKGSAKPDLVNRVKANLLEFSRVGHRLTVLLAPLLGVHLTLKVLYERGHSESQIRRDLIRRFSDNLLPTGELGFFHPNNFDLGDSIFTSRIISEALKVSGAIDIVVESLSLGDVGTFTPNQDVLSIPNDALPILRTNPGEPQFGSLTLKLRASE